jgi:hypothetical protein
MAAVVPRTARLALLGLIAAAAVCVPSAAANGRTGFMVRGFDFTRDADFTEDGTFFYGARWAVTICTPRRARVRIRAVLESEEFGREEYRFVRRQGPGCKRHRFRRDGVAEGEGGYDSRLRLAWRDQRRRTAWLSADDPAPD